MIAFAYAATGPKMTALYAGLIEGLVANIKEVMPSQKIMMLTDDETKPVSGIHALLRIARPQKGLMPWRLKCHQMAHEMLDEVIFVEPDVRFREDVTPEFTGDFDVAITTREPIVKLDDERINTSFTLGMTFSRSGEFWRQAKLECLKAGEEYQDWFGDMIGIQKVIDAGQFHVKLLDGAIYNHVVNARTDTDAKVLHYKGKRKVWLFPHAVEAA